MFNNETTKCQRLTQHESGENCKQALHMQEMNRRQETDCSRCLQIFGHLNIHMIIE